MKKSSAFRNSWLFPIDSFTFISALLFLAFFLIPCFIFSRLHQNFKPTRCHFIRYCNNNKNKKNKKKKKKKKKKKISIINININNNNNNDDDDDDDTLFFCA